MRLTNEQIENARQSMAEQLRKGNGRRTITTVFEIENDIILEATYYFDNNFEVEGVTLEAIDESGKSVLVENIGAINLHPEICGFKSVAIKW